RIGIKSSGLSVLHCRVGYSILSVGSRAHRTSPTEGSMAKKYRVTLTPEERAELEALISRGKADARELAHARILLHVDPSGRRPWAEARLPRPPPQPPGGPARAAAGAAAAWTTGARPTERAPQRFVEQRLDPPLPPEPTKRIYPRALDGRQEAHLIALAC